MIQSSRMIDTIRRVCKWNKQRNIQEWNKELNIALLLEEIAELREAETAKDTVEVLDALGDIFFVAVGAIWKLKYMPGKIQEILENTGSIPGIIAYESWLKSWDCRSLIKNLSAVVVTSLLDIHKITHSKDLSLTVLEAICTSNETKKIDKVDSSTKANIDKGMKFIPPTAALKRIVKLVNKDINK